MTSQDKYRISTCRICKSKKLINIGSLGNIAISDFTNTPQPGIKFLLELVYCEKCTLLQLAHNAPRDLLYKNYWYESHINPVIVKDLKEIATYGKGVHIDIGANDGTLLRFSKAKYRYAVDPSNVKPGKLTWINDYWENVHLGEKADVITAIACLYDLPDPNAFIANIVSHLRAEGIFISQFQPLSEMIELNDVGNICHEHLEYYSYKSLVYLYEQNGLEIFKVEKNNINGGSYRIFARHLKRGSITFNENTYRVKEIKAFFRRIEATKKKFMNFYKKHLTHITGYGASTKANTILQYYGITEIPIVDVNPNKLGKYPITSKNSIIKEIPNSTEYLWVFPYGFIDYFKKKEKKYTNSWIITIPEFKIQ